jgi:hypothetical protein
MILQLEIESNFIFKDFLVQLLKILKTIMDLSGKPILEWYMPLKK